MSESHSEQQHKPDLDAGARISKAQMITMFGAGILLLSSFVVAIVLVTQRGSQTLDPSTGQNDLFKNNSVAAQGLTVADQDRVERGRQLAINHCTTCHMEPVPNDLPKDRWPFLIQWMGHYLGHDRFTGRDRNIVMTSLIPEAQVIDGKSLADIEYYFVNSSTAEIPTGTLSSLQPLDSFVPTEFLRAPPNFLVSCACIDENRERIFLANGSTSTLLEYFFNGELCTSHDTLNTQAVGITPTSDGFVATLIGDLFGLEESGAIMVAREEEGFGPFYQYDFPLKNYYRIAHCHVADINRDGQLDYLVSGFGSTEAGAFSLLLSLPKTANAADGQLKYDRIDLLAHCGAVSSQTEDVDGDGDLDIFVLTTQGKHELWLFRNDDDVYIPKRLWKNRPSFGSTSMQLADFDKDGVKEIVVTAGNNLELPNPPVRAYHGVYIFRATDALNYQQTAFQPLPGAIGCTIDDLNNDGLLDIAAISSLPDWRQKRPVSIVVMLNDGDFEFSSFTLSRTLGTQWLAIDSGDADGDGDKDLILGGLNVVPRLSELSSRNYSAAKAVQPSVLFFKNTTQKNN